MRILFCNKFNYPFSGTESYLFDLMRRVETRGHETALFSMDHHQPSSFAGRSYLVPYHNFKDPSARFLEKAKLAAHVLYSRVARQRMRECLHDYAPDIAHIRGIYHHLSPSILWELKRQQIPVVYHLNDFKLLCPSYNFVAKGRACEACRGGRFFHVLTEGCYAGPWSSAAVLASEAYLHRWLHTYERCVDLYLAPSQFVREKLIDNGFPANRIEVLAHFQELPGEDQLLSDEKYVLYFGRLSAEKGVADLLRAMARVSHIPLVIAGDGPERARLEWLTRDLNLRNVLFTGRVDGAELTRLIGAASFSVFPSHAYETLGKSMLESYAWGRPVIASDLGSRRELLEHGRTGLLFAAGDCEQLARAIEFLFSRPDLAGQMGRAGRERVRSRHDPERHLDAILEIYSRLISARTRRAAAVRARRSKAAGGRVRVAFIGGRGVVSKYSGVESYYEQLGRELVQLGHEVTVYCRTYFTPPMRVYNGMSIVRLPTMRTKHLETLLHTAFSTLHAMFCDYDIVHYHTLGPALFSFLPRLAGKKAAVTVQGLDWQRKKWGAFASRVLQVGEVASALCPNATMVVSKTLRQHYKQTYRHGTIFVPNGTELISRRPPNHLSDWGLVPDEYVLYLGRFSPEKNCNLLIEAFESVRTNVKLVLAGGSSHSDAYVDELRRHESDRIRFLDWVEGEEYCELLSNAALFVLPSDLEGMSLALLDAMGAGLCVLASDIPENQELVSGAGFTFRRGNRSDLEQMLEFLLRDGALRAATGAKARQRIADEFLWPGIARSIEKVYFDVLGWPYQEKGLDAPTRERPEKEVASAA